MRGLLCDVLRMVHHDPAGAVTAPTGARNQCNRGGRAAHSRYRVVADLCADHGPGFESDWPLQVDSAFGFRGAIVRTCDVVVCASQRTAAVDSGIVWGCRHRYGIYRAVADDR